MKTHAVAFLAFVSIISVSLAHDHAASPLQTALAGDSSKGVAEAGVTYALTENIQLDCGCNFGVTEAAEDFNPFVGFSVRY